MLHHAGRLVRLVQVNGKAGAAQVAGEILLAGQLLTARRHVARRHADQILHHLHDLVPVFRQQSRVRMCVGPWVLPWK